MRFASRIARTAAIATLAGAGLVMPASPAGATAGVDLVGLSTAAPDASCPGTILYGVRGTNESQSAELGLGSTIYTVYRDLAGLVGSVQGVGAVYPASFIRYDQSVAKGVAATVHDLTAYATACRPQGTTFVIAGYSQGAQVVRQALSEIDESVLPHATVILFGDPNFSPSEQFVSATSRIELTGDFALDGPAQSGAPLDTSRWSVYSYCHGKDVVCASRGGVTQHLNYISIDAPAAAARAAEAYYGPQRPTRLPAPLAQLNNGSCSRDERGAASYAVSIGLSTQWAPPADGATYRFYRGTEMTPIGVLSVAGGVVNPAYQLPTIAGLQLITVRADVDLGGSGVTQSQIAQRYINVPSC